MQETCEPTQFPLDPNFFLPSANSTWSASPRSTSNGACNNNSPRSPSNGACNNNTDQWRPVSGVSRASSHTFSTTVGSPSNRACSVNTGQPLVALVAASIAEEQARLGKLSWAGPECSMPAVSDALTAVEAIRREQAAQRVLLDESIRAWKKEAEEISRQLAKVRSELAQTVEATLWSSQETANVRRGLSVCQRFIEQTDASPLSATLSARRQISPTSLTFGMNAVDESPNGSMEERLTRLEAVVRSCRSDIRRTNDFIAEAMSTVTTDVSELSRCLTTLQVDVQESLNAQMPRHEFQTGAPAHGLDPPSTNQRVIGSAPQLDIRLGFHKGHDLFPSDLERHVSNVGAGNSLAGRS